MMDKTEATKLIFIRAESLIAPVLSKLRLCARKLEFVASIPKGVRNAAVHYYGGHIAINPSELHGIELSTAIGILLHEYGHIRYRTRADGSFITVDEMKNSVAEECYCEYFAGYCIRLLNVAYIPYENFLRGTTQCRGWNYPPIAQAVQAIHDGYSAADAAVLHERAVRSRNELFRASCVGVSIVAGVFVIGKLLQYSNTATR